MFNALTNAAVATQNYPFCTIEPNTGVVPVPDERLNTIAALTGSKRIVPATITFVDIAGLIRGAYRGEGLGNQFLAQIREVDAIAQVVRCFDDLNVTHVEGSIDPIRDIEVVNLELVYADLETCVQHRQRIHKPAISGDQTAREFLALLDDCIPHLEKGLPLRTLPHSEHQEKYWNSISLLTIKPLFYIANINEPNLDRRDYIHELSRYCESDSNHLVAIHGALEEELLTLSVAEQAEYLELNEIDQSCLDQVVKVGCSVLNIHHFFTANRRESHAWTIRVGATAYEAAGKVHTDFQRGFIRAEVISYSDFAHHLGEQAAKLAGKMRVEGRDYQVVDGDILFFRSNV